MGRINVWVPDELAAMVREQLPGVNVSAVLQDAMRALLGCRHERVCCATCAQPIALRTLIDDALCALYVDLHWRLTELVDRGGTAEGSARIAKEVATRHHVSCAPAMPLPRPSREQRHRQRVLDFPDVTPTAVPKPKEQTA